MVGQIVDDCGRVVGHPSINFLDRPVLPQREKVMDEYAVIRPQTARIALPLRRFGRICQRVSHARVCDQSPSRFVGIVVRQVYLALCRIVVWVARHAQGAVATKASGPSTITPIVPQPSPWPRMSKADVTADIKP